MTKAEKSGKLSFDLEHSVEYDSALCEADFFSATENLVGKILREGLLFDVEEATSEEGEAEGQDNVLMAAILKTADKKQQEEETHGEEEEEEEDVIKEGDEPQEQEEERELLGGLDDEKKDGNGSIEEEEDAGKVCAVEATREDGVTGGGVVVGHPEDSEGFDLNFPQPAPKRSLSQTSSAVTISSAEGGGNHNKKRMRPSSERKEESGKTGWRCSVFYSTQEGRNKARKELAADEKLPPPSSDPVEIEAAISKHIMERHYKEVKKMEHADVTFHVSTHTRLSLSSLSSSSSSPRFYFSICRQHFYHFSLSLWLGFLQKDPL